MWICWRIVITGIGHCYVIVIEFTVWCMTQVALRSFWRFQSRHFLANFRATRPFRLNECKKQLPKTRKKSKISNPSKTCPGKSVFPNHGDREDFRCHSCNAVLNQKASLPPISRATLNLLKNPVFDFVVLAHAMNIGVAAGLYFY